MQKESNRARDTHLLETTEEGTYRTRSGGDRARGTHLLEMVEGGICQDTERKRPSRVHALPGDGRGRGMSGHRMKTTE